MQCTGCRAELPEGAHVCPACGREVTVGQRMVGDSQSAARETGVVVGKLGRGVVGGAKGFASGVKKGFRGSDDSKDEAK